MTSPMLAPSEIVLLNGSRYAGKPGLMDKWKLPDGETEVSRRELVQNAYAAAFLGAEAAGDLWLEVRGKKALLGLRTAQTVYAEPARAAAWPDGCIESDFGTWARRLQSKNRHEVETILYEWQESDTREPQDRALNRICRGLAGRDLLEVEEHRRLKLFTVRHFLLPAATAALAQEVGAQPAALLERCRAERPELWKLLVKAIATAMSRRVEEQDIPD